MMEPLRQEFCEVDEPAGGMTSGLVPLHEEVGMLANAIDIYFDHAGALLGMAVESIDTIVSSLQAVANGFTEGDGAGAVDDLTMAANGLHGVTAQLAERQAVLSTIPPVCHRLRTHVGQIQKSLQVLRIYGINVKIAAAGAEEFIHFVDRITARLVDGSDTTSRFDGYIDMLEEAVGLLCESDRQLARDCKRIIPQVPNLLVADAEELKAHQAKLSELATSTRQIAAKVQREVGAALCAIQVGDRARQRLEHIETALLIVEEYARDTAATDGVGADTIRQIRQHALALVGAQTEDAVREFRRDSETLNASMRQLRPNTQSLMELLGGSDHSTAQTDAKAGFLRRLEEGIAEAADMSMKIEQADFQAEATLYVIMGVVSDVADRTAEIHALRKQVQHMAINTGLRARTAVGTGPAVKVVANQILLEAEGLDTIIAQLGTIGQEFTAITSQMEAVARQQDLSAGEILERSLSAIRSTADQTEASMRRASDTSGNVHGVLTQAAEVLESCREIGERMDQLGGLIAAASEELGASEAVPPSDAGHPLWSLFSRIATSYTMAEERRIHARFVPAHLVEGSGMAAAAAAPEPVQSPAAGTTGADDDEDDAGDDDDFDDVFF